MKKDNFISLIDRAINIEEEAIITFSKHVSAASDWCECGAKDISRIKEILRKLADDSHAHKAILEGLRAKILKQDKLDI